VKHMPRSEFAELTRRIQQVVHDHMEASRQVAEVAVRQAFSTGGAVTRGSVAGRHVAAGRRRLPEEIADIGDKLYQLVCANPGERMAALASKLGTPATQLSRPMANLKESGRVRSVGQRHLTRYFPVAGSKSG